MLGTLIKIGTGALNAVYSVMKLAPVKNRIVFLSRQSNKPSYDIRALDGWFRDKGFETVVLCREMGEGPAAYAGYMLHMLKQMRCMAGAKMVILDTYCIAACLLHHRDDLLIAQMWHALGSLKKFSLSILDQAGGRSSETANIMHMHEQYDIIFTSSQASRGAFAEAFGYDEEALTVMSLPRVDAILDTYCIAACLLRHRDELLIAQMWHALGSLKKFSLSILDQAGGRSSQTANIMHMHEQYDIIFTSSEASRGAFAEAFGYDEEALTVMRLPRVDAILDQERDEKNKEKIRSTYPRIGEGGRRVLLYAPTFRKGKDISEDVKRLIDTVDYSRYDLIVKLHPLDAARIAGGQAIVDRKFSTMDMLSICDVVITDYSAVTYEAALKGRPLVFYAFDIGDYIAGRDFYLDYNSEIPGPVRESAAEVMEIIDRGEWEPDKVRQFADKYIEKRERCTEEMGQYLLDRIANR